MLSTEIYWKTEKDKNLSLELLTAEKRYEEECQQNPISVLYNTILLEHAHQAQYA